tara:strand:- start:694 stop:1134 length:441 start_codon:yes stop_codon:yes gene_type:complete
MRIEIINDFVSDYKFNKNTILNILSSIYQDEKKKIKSVNFIFTNDDHLKSLKKTYFNQNYYTDVISFNLESESEEIEGEIYISMERIIENSIKFSCTVNEELKRIVIHGFLHLFGYDDQSILDKKKMTALENKYINIHINSILLNK